MSFVGLRLMKSGGETRLIAFLRAGVVEIEPTEADLAHEAGYYSNAWDPADPFNEGRPPELPPTDLVAPGTKGDSLVPEQVLEMAPETDRRLDTIIRTLKIDEAARLARGGYFPSQ